MTESLKFISKNELANSLGISVSTINRKLKELPHTKLGNQRTSRVLFSVPKIQEYLEGYSSNKKRASM